jgi:hypothetical protein
METFMVIVAAVLLATGSSAAPQYQYQQPTAAYSGAYGAGTTGCSTCGSAGAGGSSAELSGAAGSFEQSFSRPPQQGGGFGGGGGGGGGNNLNTECRRQEVGPGQFKFICDGVQSDLITLRSEHILWLTSDGNGPQVVDIEVPNYKIDELIKAGYKTTAGGATKINVLLKRPEQTADAEVDVPKGAAGSTSVNLQYEPPVSQKVHFPNDKQYRPLSGPILPPLAGDRGRRQIAGPVQHQQQQQQVKYQQQA